jgi:tellurium resistance protein TerD
MSRTSAINLEKGESRDVQQGIRRVMVGCGWDAQQDRSAHAFDLDVACVLLNEKGRMPSDAYLVYFNGKRFRDDVIVHTGDNLTGDGDGDDERLLIDLARVPREVAQIDVLMTIYDGAKRGQTFGMISDCYVRVVDVTLETETGTRGPLYDRLSYPGREFCRCNVNDAALEADGLLFGSLLRDTRGWRFQSVQKEIYGGLKAYLATVAPDFSDHVLSLPPSLRIGPRVSNALQLVVPEPALLFLSDNRRAVGASVIALGLTQFIGLGPLCVMLAVFLAASFLGGGRRQ